MANPIVSQTDQYCKVENNPKLYHIIEKYSRHGLEHYCAFAAILKRGNGEAAEFLKSMGCTGIIPFTFHIPIEEAAKFYNVDRSYLYSLLHRVGFNTRSVGNEYISEEPSVYFHQAGLHKLGKFVPPIGPSARNKYDYVRNDTGEHYVMRIYGRTTIFISARAVLSVAPLIAYTRGASDKDHVSVRIRKAIEDSDYLTDGIKNLIAETEKSTPVQEDVVEEASAPSGSGVTLSKDELFSMIKQAVREVLSDTRVEVPAKITITT